ncbi:MAG: c-type cytochrome [Bacteroidia bacterium]
MKKIVKIVVGLLGIVLFFALCGAGFIYFRGIPTYPVNMPDNLKNLKVEVSPQKVDRGLKIAAMLCKQCHLGEDGKLSGKKMLDLPTDFGTAYTMNITQSKEKGIGNWTDGQLFYFLRTGIKPSGEYAPAYMPKFPNMADSDLEAVIAYLRSATPEVQASEIQPPKNQPNFMVKFLCNVAFKPFPLPEKPIVVPDSANKIELGKYLANGMINCYGCHSADFKTVNDLNPEKSVGFYGGGNPLLNEEGQVIPSSNITMDSETGIGKVSEQQFIEAVKYCKKPGSGNPLRYPMIPHTTLTDYEASAIYAYLQTVPKVVNKVEGK